MQSTSPKTSSVLAAEYLRELEAEATATRACLKNVPMEKADWKPHDKSMPLGYLAAMIAEMPKWIQYTIEEGEIDFGTFQHDKIETTDELVAAFDKNMTAVRRALGGLSDEGIKETFSLKNKGKLLFSSAKDESISQSINHLVHHRGQLSVYLRLNDLPVPSIYGPSADDTAGFEF
jgi:uncharacterized damage-inducible protein DinB